MTKNYNPPEVHIVPLECEQSVCFSGGALSTMEKDTTSSWEED